MSRFCTLLLLAGAILLPSAVFGQAAPRAGRLTKEEQAALKPGLLAEYYPPGDLQTPIDAQLLRVAALHVPAGEPVTPFVPAGPFSLRVSGYLKVAQKGDYTLHLRTSGPVTLRVNDAPWQVQLDANAPITIAKQQMELVKGYNKLEIIYHHPLKTAATLRVTWSGSDFIEEPLPPDALFARGDQPSLEKSSALYEGRQLWATRGCVKCHDSGIAIDKPGAMPELTQSAPQLGGVGSRLNEAWLRAWIIEPKKLRATATMPQVLHGSAAEQTQQAADLAAYLVAQTDKEPVKKPAEATEEQVETGVKHFENLGCIACHHLQPPETEDALKRRSLHFATAKFAPGQLSAFLQAPHKHYAWSRMPDFKLSGEEADALTALIAARVKGEIKTEAGAPKGDTKRGEMLFTSVGCANCHSINDKPVAVKLLPLAKDKLTTGCLAAADAPHDKAPQHRFAAADQKALAVFLATDRQSLAHETPAAFARRQVKLLNCTACHRRDGEPSALTTVLQEESEVGLTPEILPLLTWTGEKLQPAWTEKLLAGHLDQRARPWLRARMPAFPARAKLLAVGLSHEHGFAVDEDEKPKPNADLAKIGAQLVGDRDGFSCIKCHAVGKQPAGAPFEAPGINLVSAAERLRHSYYPRWMLDPPRVDVASKMPKFAVDGKTTTVPAFEGNAAKQYEALWQYLQTLK